MTEKRKEELRQLLQDAMNNLVIRVRFESRTISKEKYIETLRKRCKFYGVSNDHNNNYDYLLYQPDIRKEKTKTDLLEFIRRELNQFIEDGEIRYTRYNIDGCATDGFRLSEPHSRCFKLSDILEYLLKVAIAFGTDKAVLSFDEDSRPDGNLRNYQSITSFEGITIETEIQICRGIRLVPIPRDIAFQLNHNLSTFHRRHRDKGTTLLIIERLRHSVFHKPSETIFDEDQPVNLPFQVEANEIELSNEGMVWDFRETFCQALSLACDTMVMFDYFWHFSAADVFRSIPGDDNKGFYSGPIGKPVEAGQSEIEEAKRLYKILEVFDQKPTGQYDQKTKGTFQIAIERWRQSKTYRNLNKMIDLCIAFESLYLPGINDELKFRLGVRAAWFLGEDKDNRKRLLAVFKKIYDWRSTIVHGGEFKNRTVTIDEETIPVSELLTEAQDLCQKSIVKILKKYSEDGKYPDDDYWNDLILG